MRSTRSILIAAVAAASLLAPASAMAGDDPAPDGTLPPAFTLPAPTPVTDVATAETFTQNYASRNAPRFLGSDRRRTRVTDVQARCLEHPVIADRFGCIFTLRASVWERGRNWGHSSRLKSRHGDDHGNRGRDRRVRVRNFGCLGALSITGGPTATPSATLRFVECARVPRGDYLAPEPVV
jgi:hypothetical protein